MIRFIKNCQTFPLRKKVLRSHQPNPILEFEGDSEPDTIHLGYFENEEIIGIVTLIRRGFYWEKDFYKNAYQLRGMAVDPQFQNQNIGNALLHEVENQSQTRGVDFIWCNARENALNFYLKNGYELIGGSFEIPDIGRHYKMFKSV